MDIIFKGRRTDVPERFRSYASAKLTKITKLAHKAIRVNVEVSAERNPRQASQRERVELTILSRGPAIRAEAAADDQFAALDRAVAKLEERLRRSGDRRKAARHGALQAGRNPGPRGSVGSSPDNDGSRRHCRTVRARQARQRGVARANQWSNLLKTPPGSNPMDMGWRSGAREPGHFTGSWSPAAMISRGWGCATDAA